MDNVLDAGKTRIWALPLLTGAGGYRRQYFRLDGTFESCYYAQIPPVGKVQLRILCKRDARMALNNLLLSDLAPKNPGLYVEHDA